MLILKWQPSFRFVEQTVALELHVSSGRNRMNTHRLLTILYATPQSLQGGTSLLAPALDGVQVRLFILLCSLQESTMKRMMSHSPWTKKQIHARSSRSCLV